METVLQFLTNVSQAVKKPGNAIPSELSALSNQVQGAVESFLTDTSMVTRIRKSQPGVISEGVTLESIQANSFDSSMEALLKSAAIPQDLQPTAAMIVANLVAKYVTGGQGLLSKHFSETEGVARREGYVGLEHLFTPEAMSTIVGPGLEAFGANVTQTIPDLKAAIAVSLMAFHTGVGPRLMPVRPVTEPAVRIDVDRLQVYDVDNAAAAKNLVELYADPSLVENTLRSITVLAANDDDDVLVANNQIRFEREANILELSIDATNPALERVNATDLVADGVKLASIRVTITDTTAPVAVTETFILTFPESKARFTRMSNSNDAADRGLTVTHDFFLTAGSDQASGVDTVLLSTLLPASEGVRVRVHFSGRINIRTGVAFAQCSVSMAAHNPAGGAISQALTALMATLESIAPTSYTLDAKHDEQNKRKTAIVARSLRRPMEYEIPVGRNYVVDFALHQEDDATVVGSLSKLMRIGEDAVVVTMVDTTVNNIVNELAAINQGLNSDASLGMYYAAGQLINPAVYTGTLDLSDITSMRDSDRSGDVKQRVVQFLTGVVAHLQQDSFIAQQLPAGVRPTWRVLTSPLILDAVVGLPHIHNHLNKGAQVADSSGVEYRMVLDNGVVLEFVTTTFASMELKMAVLPYLPGAPDSVLNFGLLADYGTLVGSYQNTDGRAVNRRVYASTRQLPIPTCPVAAIIDVSGIDVAMFLEAGS